METIEYLEESSHKLTTSFQKQYNDLADHRAISHPLFSFLEKQSTKSLNPLQFQAIRDNYIYRTLNTIPCIAHALIAAVKNLDYRAISLLGKNLSEETGEGKMEQAHVFCYYFLLMNTGSEDLIFLPFTQKGLIVHPLFLRGSKILLSTKMNYINQSNILLS